MTSTLISQAQEALGVVPVFELVGGDDPGAERAGEVLALAWAQTDLHFAPLQVAGGPVVENGVAKDVPVGFLGGEVAALAARHAPDDGGDLGFEVQQAAPGRNGDLFTGGRGWCAGW